jgi:glutathione S-transferase
MADGPDITLYRGIATRAVSTLWMLEELGVAYRSVIIDRKAPRTPEFLAINPTGMVPALTDGAAVVTEGPAICLYLADLYGSGTLAPRIDDPRRGAYLSWLVYATAQIEPARRLPSGGATETRGHWGGGWQTLDAVVTRLDGALRNQPWLLGDDFTAADVMVGATIVVSLVTGELPAHPTLVAYNARIAARPAFQCAGALNWPADLFPPRGE